MNPLILNSVRSLNINGILTCDGTPCPAHLSRVRTPKDLINPFYKAPQPDRLVGYYQEKTPEPPRSTLPPPGNLHLTATLGTRMGNGRVGVVFELKDVHVENAPGPVAIPPLVVKIAYRNRVPSLAREAWFYNELESLQGSTIARCYGWFEMDLQSSSKDAGGRPYTILNWKGVPSGAMDPSISREARKGKVHSMLVDRSIRRDILSVLVLEKLGPMLPIGPKVSKEIRRDIRSLYNDIGRLGVNLADDIRRENILQAPPSTDVQPRLPSPYSKRVHEYRIIDFDQAMKSNQTIESIKADYKEETSKVFSYVEDPDYEEF